MSDDLLQRIRRLQSDFLAAVGQGPDAVVAFNADYAALLKEVKHALISGPLPPDVGEIAHAAFAALASQATVLLDYDTGAAELLRTESEGDVDESSSSSPSVPAASAPLFRYFLANVAFPYPEHEEKERIAEEVQSLGWRDFDKKKFEDWLNRKRHQSGFLAAMRRYCGEDREGMRSLCQKVLYGSAAEKASLPNGAVEDIEDICDFLRSQYDDLAADSDTTWVDELTIGVEALFYQHSSEALPVNDSSDSSDSESDSDWDLSDTDVEVEDDEEEPVCVVIGAKRKLAACSENSHHLTSRTLTRSLSMASSTSSSSTACSLRSFSGTNISSLTSVGWTDDSDIDDRPPKRCRSESCSLPLEQKPAIDSVQVAPPCATAANPLFSTYQTKRKRADVDLATRMRSMKRYRYALLGVASDTNGIFDSHLSALSNICSVNWTLAESALSDFDIDAYTIDCTQPDYLVEMEDMAVFSGEVDKPAEDILTWSKLQVYTVFRMLLPAAIRPLPPALTQSTTLSFDVNNLSPHDVTSLSQLFALTPEDIAAMYESMNVVAPPLETSTPIAEDATSPTSSSSSEGSSPPALSDDSGSSTRSSSVEPSIEQDSLLMSPAALSADYSQLYNALFSGKPLDVDPSRVNVELGETPDVDIAADGLSGAADLLARYLQDSMTAV